VADGRAIVLAQITAGVASLAMPFMLARFMSVADYAAFVTVLAAGSFLAILAGLGMDRALYRFVPAIAQSGRPCAAWSVLARACALRLILLAVLLTALATARPWFPDAIQTPLLTHGAWIAGLALAFGLNELASAGLQSALRPLPQARSTAAVALGRLAIISTIAATSGHVPLSAALSLLVGSEVVLASCGLTFLRASLAMQNVGVPLVKSPTTSELLAAGVANHGAYLLGLLWSGSTLRLLVAATSPVATTAAYGLFQLLADRGRMFLPVAFMQRQIESHWAADFGRRGRAKRFQAAAGAIGKLQFHALVAVGILLVAAGPWLLAELLRPEYAHYQALVLLLVVQQSLGGYTTLLWMGANASGRNGLLIRAMFGAALIGAPLLWLTARWVGVEAMVIVTMLPALLLAADATLRGEAVLVRALFRPIARLQLACALAALGTAWLLSLATPPGVAAPLSLVAYVVGMLGLSRTRRAAPLLRSERFLLARYFGRMRA
jgi:O-antigen/teichoic acid export membrane protein